jgi:NAD(P)-dependent dehydrogenase (short-subunit alcohol dehydrogenase family)
MSIFTGVKRFLVNRLYAPKDPVTSFAGKTILITGANVGLGFYAATKFVALGASSLIIGVRDLKKGNRAKEAIEEKTGRKDVIKVWQVDMLKFESVKAFADKVSTEVDKLDVVELNAGMIDKDYGLSPEGWEQTLQVNVLSTALLALLLLPKLRSSRSGDEPTHLSIVGSGSHVTVREEPFKTDGKLLEWLGRKEDYNGQKQYAISKLLVEWVTKELAAIMTEPSGKVPVIVNSLCPGFCKSDLARSYTGSWINWIGAKIFYGLFARTSEEGSRTLVSGTTQGVESHAKFWKNDGYPEYVRLRARIIELD